MIGHPSKPILFFVVLITVASLVAACSQAPAPASSGTQSAPIVIGKMESLSGATAFEGVRTRDGAMLAVKRANEDGGVRGRQLVLKVADTKSDPAAAVSAMEQLIARENPVAMLAPYGSPYGVPLGTAMVKYALPTVFIWSATDPMAKIANVYPWAFNSGPLQPYYYRAFVDVVKLAQQTSDPPKTIAITHVSGAFGEGMAKVVTEGFSGLKGITEATGLKIVATEPYEQTTTDLRPMLLRLKALNPDILFFTSNTPDTILLIKQIREVGLGAKMVFGPFTPMYQDVMKGLGNALDGVTTIDLTGPGVKWPASEKHPKLLPSTDELAAAMKETYGYELLDTPVIVGYDQAALLIAAMRDADSLEKGAIISAMSKLKTNTPAGPADWSATGIAGEVRQGWHHMIGFQFQGGTAVPITPSDIAKGKLVYPATFK